MVENTAAQQPKANAKKVACLAVTKQKSKEKNKKTKKKLNKSIKSGVQREKNREQNMKTYAHLTAD